MPIFVYSTTNQASANIAKRLKEGWNIEATPFTEEIVRPPAKFKQIETDLIIFLSSHKSAAGKPAFTAHSCGVFSDDTSVGGNAHELSIAAPSAQKAAMLYFKEHPFPGFEVTLEATHHGPTDLKLPILFVELGSTQQEWQNEKAAEIVAAAAVAASKAKLSKEVAIGFGGGHYCPNFNKVELEGEIAMGHIAAKYAFPYLNENLVKQMIEKSQIKPKIALIDWKSFNSAERKLLLDLLEKIGLKYERA